MKKFLVEFSTKNAAKLGLEVFAYTRFDAEREVRSRHPDANILWIEEVSEKATSQQLNSVTSDTSSSSGGSLFIIGLLVIALAIVVQIVLFILVIWEFLLYTAIIIGLIYLCFKLESDVKKMAIGVSLIAIPLMIFRMDHLVDNYKEYYANKEKLHLETQLQEAEQINKESNEVTEHTSAHKKATSQEPESIKNAEMNPSDTQKETEQTIEASPEFENADNTSPSVDHTSEPSVLLQSAEVTN